MSDDNNGKKLEGSAVPSITDPIINKQTLALLHKSDRTIIMAVGLIMSLAGTAIFMLGKDRPDEIVLFTAITIVAVISLMILVYLRGSQNSGLEARLNSENAAARAVNGHWWQIVRTRDHPGLTYVAIGISGVAERSAMVGRTYDSKGNVVATFSSDTVAIRTTSPTEIFYLWTGTVMDDVEIPLVFGLGRFRFDSVGHEDRPLFGGGTFTRGSEHLMKFDTARPVEMRRFTDEEEKRLSEDPEVLDKLAVEAYLKFNIPEGGTLAEAQTEGGDTADTRPPEAVT